MFYRLFLRHPHSVGEGYFEHQRRALQFAGSLLAGGMACFVHGLIPALFLQTGSRTVSRLYEPMVISRNSRVAVRRKLAQ